MIEGTEQILRKLDKLEKDVTIIKEAIMSSRLTNKEEKLSKKTIKEIKEARERIEKGEFYTEKEANQMLGL